MSQNSLKIVSGSRVAVVGGGPAGSFFALHLLRYARESGLHPEITIYQEHRFDELGPRGCKGCAGILAIPLLRNLRELGLSVPEGIIQSKIEHYTVHSSYASISISNPEKGIEIVSVYRGAGPRLSHIEPPVSFDGWLLEQAEKEGARVEYRAVSRIDLKPGARVEVAGRSLEYDLVVLAMGVNARPVPIYGLNYVPPETRPMAQDEVYASSEEVASRLGSAAHAFLIPHSEIIFGTLVPKGPFINVSVLSSGERPVSVTDFLDQDLVRSILPEHYQRACGCRPNAVASSARNYYADRFVTVGDAVAARLYKDGIGSALLTAREAACTAVYHGVSREDFKRYYEPFCARIDRDNWWGRLLFSINHRVKDSPAFLLAQHRLIGDEQSDVRGPQPFTKGAWGMFTGTYSYRDIARMTLNPASLVKLSVALFREGLFRRKVTRPRRLHVGSTKVLILGCGFGGTYVLRHLVPSLNRNENVETTMVSDENFFLFTPLLHEVAMGQIETRHIAYPIRRLQWRDRFNFVQATVEKIDLAEREVTTTLGTLDFDYLVLALGSIPDTSALNLLGENVFTLKTLGDSMLIRNHIIGLFERASIEKEPERRRQLLTFVIAGGGYIGVQLVTELGDFIYRNLLRFYKGVAPADVRIIVVEAEPKVVPELHPKLSSYVMRHLQRTGIELRLRSRVTRAGVDRVEINNEEIILASTLIWVAGVVANPQTARLDVAKDNIGRVKVNEYLELPGVPGVYALGDCCHFPHPKTGRPIPPLAHTTVRQAKVVAHNILADLRGRDKRPYRYSHTAQIISLGGFKAVFRFYGLRLYGFPARLIWLAAYSLLVTGMYNRVRIATDWLLSLLFGRDITLLKLMTKSTKEASDESQPDH